MTRFSERKKLYKKIESDRDSKVLSFIMGTRHNLEAQIARDCIDPFVEILDSIGPSKRIL